MEDAKLLVGIETSDDAGVYLINEETALLHTVDFFTPIVDDPRRFGQIAAANALSDIYAMGGQPLTAMNIICYPTREGNLEVLAQILMGGAEKVKEAGALIVGGHSVEDKEPKYGLAVTGVVAPDQLVRNSTARPGDRLVLTKPLGTGIVTSAVKAKMVPPGLEEAVSAQMAALNDRAARAMREAGPSACTDVTGFGLLGHAMEMARGSGVGLIFEAAALPLIERAPEYASLGLIPRGAHANRCFIGDDVSFEAGVPLAIQDIMFDPQTSGGLLIAVPEVRLQTLMDKLAEYGVREARVIGRITDEIPAGKILVR
jgi:selenide,water dikinase